MDINATLRTHQQERSEVLTLLHSYLPRIIARFYGELPLPALSLDSSPSHYLGWYCEEDGLTLSHRINISSLYPQRPLADVLRTLTHELGHEWQYLYGKPGRPPYHNKQFQAKMLEIGISCNSRGASLGMQEPFVSFLKELGVEAEILVFKQEKEVGSSKSRTRLKPWACQCTRVWASVRVEVDATCGKCGKKFARTDRPVSVDEAREELKKLVEVDDESASLATETKEPDKGTWERARMLLPGSQWASSSSREAAGRELRKLAEVTEEG